MLCPDITRTHRMPTIRSRPPCNANSRCSPGVIAVFVRVQNRRRVRLGPTTLPPTGRIFDAPCRADSIAATRIGRQRHADSQPQPVVQQPVYTVTKQIDFCYGHRLLEYEGRCAHPHGHNAVADIALQATSLDASDMVCDFGDVKQIMKAWIDRELDHKMILRRDDPLLPVLRHLGEPVFVMDHNPTAEQIARLIFERAQHEGLPVVRVTVWETPTASATYALA